jgi:Domain of unknown function (DUF4864)
MVLVLSLGLVAMLTGASPARAGEAESIAAARAIIEAQIAAFKSDDGATAYSFAAPEIQAAYPNPDAFMGMVRGGYKPVYRPQSYNFQPGQVTESGAILQRLDIIGPDGDTWVAEYVVRALPDGSMRIGGCRLIKNPGAGA